MTRITHKRGASFTIQRNAADDGMTVTEGWLDEWTARSQIRAGATLLADLSVTFDEGEDAELGAYTLSTDQTTVDWPLGRAAFDVEYTHTDGAVMKGETVAVDIIASPTYPPEGD